MTITKTYTIKCPRCGRTQSFNAWKRINGNAHPQLAKKIISGEILKFTCAYCHCVLSIEYDIIYEDNDSKYIVCFQCGNHKNISFSGKYSVSYCSSYDDFAEEVSIISDRLNKNAVFLLKRSLISQNTAALLSVKYMFMRNNMLFFSVKTFSGKSNIECIPFSLYEEAKDIILNDILNTNIL